MRTLGRLVRTKVRGSQAPCGAVGKSHTRCRVVCVTHDYKPPTLPTHPRLVQRLCTAACMSLAPPVLRCRGMGLLASFLWCPVVCYGVYLSNGAGNEDRVVFYPSFSGGLADSGRSISGGSICEVEFTCGPGTACSGNIKVVGVQ